jgi:predicted transcriptional regulator of viral defense system
VSVGDAAEILALDRHAAAKHLARWAEQGWLRRVRRGLYIPVPVDSEHPEAWGADPILVADTVWNPCYITGWTAANHWGLTEQIFRTIVLKTTERVRRSQQQLLGSDFFVSHTNSQALAWGIRRDWREERAIRFADPARTVIDVLDDPRLSGGIRLGAEILTAYLSDYDASTLVEYGDLVGNRTVFKRIGFLAERIGADDSLLVECEQRLSAGFPLLDPTQPRRSGRSRRWRLTTNANLELPESS